MKLGKYFLIFFILINFANAANEDTFSLSIKKPEVKQGEIVEAEIFADNDDLRKLHSIIGQNAGESLFLVSLQGPLGNEKRSILKIIFTKKPEKNEVIYKVGDKEMRLRWNEVKIIPVEAPDQFIFSDFIIPVRKKFFVWFVCLLLAFGTGVLFYKAWKKGAEKKSIKNQRRKLKEEVLCPKNYEEIVALWRNKQQYLKIFPEIGPVFRELEEKLFVVQFKPYQTEEEKGSVVSAFKQFREKVMEKLNGV